MSDTEKQAASKGLEGVVAATTKLSDVRGLDGELIYCGYNINELAGKATYEEVVHLLHRGKLPNSTELAALKVELAAARKLPDGVIELIKQLPNDASPMRAIRTVVSALACYEPPEAQDSLEDQATRAIKLIAQVPVITAYFHLARQGKPLPESDPNLGEAANFLYLVDGEKPSEAKEKTIDMCYILHADHGMNASTFSARVTIATLSGMYSAITSAIGTLKGPLHGGANEGVIKMLQEIGSVEKVDEFVADCIKNKKKIMGIGHRVYKVLDPRAPHLQAMAKKLSGELGETKWLDMSERIREIMVSEKNLYPNVDFYSATVYYSLGIPTDLFTPIFAIARTSGWTAHVLEQLADNRLIRPKSLYDGPDDLKYTPVDER
ncbi:MAG: citrate synthase [Opitutia bacterium TMED67]|nr:citrate synthase [Verrucomicrobiales bacterium]OUU72541.1 MAG: citrate synthase [Opitutae bacterium TMED67]RZO60934.1 MAG: citrate synthase [Limisphaerales bacterium]|tara:strand:+ start:10189 stop:11325 length:1137 start_codon:yes stop_codon:yes gene_type:complete